MTTAEVLARYTSKGDFGGYGHVKKRLSEATRKRVKAGRMLRDDKSCTEVELAVGVARQSVYPWKRVLDEGVSTHFGRCPSAVVGAAR